MQKRVTTLIKIWVSAIKIIFWYSKEIVNRLHFVQNFNSFNFLFIYKSYSMLGTNLSVKRIPINWKLSGKHQRSA